MAIRAYIVPGNSMYKLLKDFFVTRLLALAHGS